MKVNQIVSEHKKGVRAMKYGKKTKGTVPVYGPDAKNAAKLKPVKPIGPGEKVDETIDIKPMPGAAQITSDGKAIGTADAATANVIKQAVEKGTLNLNPDGQPQPAAVAEDPEETRVVGGDPTDELIAQTTDWSAEPEDGPGFLEGGVDREIEPPSIQNTVGVKIVNGKPMASDGDVIEVTSTRREVDARYVQEPDNATNRVGYVVVNGKPVMALNTGHKWKVGPLVFQQITNSNPSAPGVGAGIRVKESRDSTETKFKSDLDAMLTIAGLR